MAYSYNKIWKLISIIGILLISIDLFSIIFLVSSSPSFYHFPIDKSYQSYLIKYQLIFICISLWLFNRYKRKSTIFTSTIIWFFCLINAIFSRVSALSSGNIYELSLIIIIFCIFSSALSLMIYGGDK